MCVFGEERGGGDRNEEREVTGLTSQRTWNAMRNTDSSPEITAEMQRHLRNNQREFKSPLGSCLGNSEAGLSQPGSLSQSELFLLHIKNCISYHTSRMVLQQHVTI